MPDVTIADPGHDRWVRETDIAIERAKLERAVLDAIMAYLAPGSQETFRATKDACQALRDFEAGK